VVFGILVLSSSPKEFRTSEKSWLKAWSISCIWSCVGCILTGASTDNESFLWPSSSKCRSIIYVCIPWSFDHSDPSCVQCVLSTPSNAPFIVTTMLRSSLPIWRWCISRKLSVSGHMLYRIFEFFFNKEPHYLVLVGEFCFTLCVYEVYN
jgi:hypothetical protein